MNQFAPLLAALLPSLAVEMEEQLRALHEEDLATQVANLAIVDRCRCHDDFCGTFYTQPQPVGSYGPGHRCIDLPTEHGYLILDVLHEQIMSVEVLYRNEIRDVIHANIL